MAVELETVELGVVLGELEHLETVDLLAGLGEVDEVVVAGGEGRQGRLESFVLCPQDPFDALAHLGIEIRIADLIGAGGGVRSVGVELLGSRRTLGPVEARAETPGFVEIPHHPDRSGPGSEVAIGQLRVRRFRVLVCRSADRTGSPPDRAASARRCRRRTLSVSVGSTKASSPKAAKSRLTYCRPRVPSNPRTLAG